ncbi:hypothetical protein TRFO_20364 [Tritrichomonas foetus]|uniref:BEACH domain-containing protein n=1 Tax=Tritrichomonas foetus TaxID=1144522 RepID=A0A1J4KG56_9EUKA|nr:hypothetical protein TRFO_20364 [Tritrichomonas foetus]|eukprot:OHT10399.1 hypothetical protein TRFO_20364 [Tritrichomonas foetus]
MNVFRKYQQNDRFIKCTQTIFKIPIQPCAPAFPPKLLSKIPQEKMDVILKKKPKADALIDAAGLHYEIRSPLLKSFEKGLTAKNLNKSQLTFLAQNTFRSCCGVLFWDITQTDPASILTLARALTKSIPFLNIPNVNVLDNLKEFFANFSEKIAKIDDIDILLKYLPALNEIIENHSDYVVPCYNYHMDMCYRICQRLEKPCQAADFMAIANYLKSFSRSVHLINDKKFDPSKLVTQMLTLIPRPFPIELYISELILFLAFHHYSSDLLPLIEKISLGIVDSNPVKVTTEPSSSNPRVYVQNTDPLQSCAYIDTFPEGIDFNHIERPTIPNLNGLPANDPTVSYAVTAASEISEHFLQCRASKFLPFAKFMLESQNRNVQAVLILVIMVLGPYKEDIAKDFTKNEYWNILFSDNNFNESVTFFSTPNNRVVNFRQSIFDLVSFLSINKSITSSVRQSYVSLLTRTVHCPELISEILLMSYPQLQEIYSLQNVDDPLYNTILEIAVSQQNDHLQTEKALKYRVQSMAIILTILKTKESINRVSTSQFACEALLSMLREKSLVTIVEKYAGKLLQIASYPRTNFVPFTSALHKLLGLLKNNNESFSLLLLFLNMLEKNSTPILLKSPLIIDIYNIILICTSNTPDYYKILETSLKILFNVKNFLEFDPSTVPCRSIASICSNVGVTEDLFQILYKLVISDNVISMPEGIQLLLLAVKGTERANFVLNNLIELCEKSVCNRSSCILGNIPNLASSMFKFSQSSVLMKYIFYSICNVLSLRSFMHCFEFDNWIEIGLKTLIDITENADDLMKPHLQFSTIPSRLSLATLNSNVLQNGFVVSATIFIDSDKPNHDFFEFAGDSLRLAVSFLSRAISYKFESHKGIFEKTIEVEYPIKEWFVLAIIINPSQGISLAINGQTQTIIKTPSFTLEQNVEITLFQKTNTAAPSESIQLFHVFIAGDFQPNEVNINSSIPTDVMKAHILSRFSAENSLATVKNKNMFNAFAIPMASSFIRSFESSQSIHIILSLFTKIGKMPSIIDDLLNILFLLLKKSPVIANQLVECGGFAIIASFIQKLDQPEISVDRWYFMINSIRPIHNESLLKSFARHIFYNFEIWSKAHLNVQYVVISDWVKLALYADIFHTIPFLLSIYNKFTDVTGSNKKVKINIPTDTPDEDSKLMSSLQANTTNDSDQEKLRHMLSDSKSLPLSSSTNDILPHPTNNLPSPLDPQSSQKGETEKTVQWLANEDNAAQGNEENIETNVENIDNTKTVNNHENETKSEENDVQQQNDDESENKVENVDNIPSLETKLTINGKDPIDPKIPHKKKAYGPHSRSSFDESSNTRIPPHPRTRVTRSNSISALVSQKKGISKPALVRSSIISMIKKCILKHKINSKDAQFLFQAIHNSMNPEITLELLDIIEFIVKNDMGELLSVEGSEWMILFLHQNEVVRIKWMSIFAVLFPMPSEELTRTILLLMVVQSQRPISQEITSENSILATCCRASLFYSEGINLEEVIKPPPLCASPMYLHIAIAVCIAAPLSLSDVFSKFLLAVCSMNDNVELIAKSSTSLSLFLLIYWAIKRSLRDLDEISTMPHVPRHKQPIQRRGSEVCPPVHHKQRRFTMPTRTDTIDRNAVSIVARICAESPKLLGSALGIIDSIMHTTDVNLISFRSVFVNNAFELIAKRPNSEDTPFFIKILVESLFFHHKTFPNKMIPRLMEESKMGIAPRIQPKKNIAALPDLVALVNLYSGKSGNGNTNAKYYFSLIHDSKGNWADKGIANSLIFYISTLKDERLRTYMTILVYFYFQAQSQAEISPILPLIEPLLHAKDANSFLIVKALLRFQIPNQKYQEYLKLAYKSSESNKSKSIRRQSDYVGDDGASDDMPSPSATAPMSSPIRVQMVGPLQPIKIPQNIPDKSDLDEISKLLSDFFEACAKLNVFEHILDALDEFTQETPKLICEMDKALVRVFADVVKVIPTTKSTTLRLTAKINGEGYWRHLSHQMYTTNQNHFKRSSYVDASLRPVILKCNHDFDENGGRPPSTSIDANNISQQFRSSNYEYRIDSSIALFEAPAQHVKIANIINGTFSVFPNIFRFISNEGKMLEIPIVDVALAMPMISLQRYTAVEMITVHHKSYLFNFMSTNEIKVLSSYINIQFPTSEAIRSLTDQWVKREITNFEYLTWLNIYSGRTFNSAYSYPVFPWILSDYTSESLKLDDPSSYRDLSKPIGALNPTRLEKLKILRDDNIDSEKFLYRSTYSCAFHIYHYMVRLEPFTSLHIMMQDGKFDVASRLFTSIENSYDRVVGTAFNFRELIPEFFFCADFLRNEDNNAFGGDVNNVELPPWAKNALHFIYLHRQALESEYVSQHLHEWIDLIWGYKQTGQAAEDADNTFDKHLYPTVWEEYTNPTERTQIEELLSHVGQIPQKLFDSPHPRRSTASSLTQNFSHSSQTVYNSPIICINRHQWTLHNDGKVYSMKTALPKDYYVPYENCIQCSAPLKNGFVAVRKYSNDIYIVTDVPQKDKEQEKEVSPHTIKHRQQHISPIVAICSIGKHIITGDVDGTLANDTCTLTTVHKCKIVAICASEMYSTVVSVSIDGLVSLCTANSLSFIRSFKIDIPQGFVPCRAAVCKGFGLIVIAATTKDQFKSVISVYSINGEKITTSTVNMNIKQMIAATGINDMDYIVIADEKGRVHLVNAFELKIIKVLYESESPVSALSYFSSTLLIGTEAGNLKYGSLSI